MRVLRRILAKASQKKVHNLFQVVFYFILLFGNLACLFIYINVQKEAEKVEKSIYRTVLVNKIWRADGTDCNTNFSSTEIERLEQEDGIENWLGIMLGIKQADGIVPYEIDLSWDFHVIGVDNTEEYQLFSMQGLEIQEGIPITEKNCKEDVVLISDKLAVKNNLKLGDTITFRSSEQDYAYVGMRETEVKIVGIFTYPEEDSSVRTPMNSKANLFFVPTKVLANNLYMGERYDQLQICVKNAKDVPGFVANMKQLFPDAKDEYGQYFCQYIWGEGWYEQIARPYEQILGLARILILVIGLGSVVCVYLIGSVWLRDDGNESEVLLGMGEKKRTVITQFLLEEGIPFLIGAVFAFGVSLYGYKNVIPKINNYYQEQRETINEELKISKWEGQEETIRKDIFEPELQNIRYSDIGIDDMEILELLMVFGAVTGAFVCVRGGQLWRFLNE